MQKFKKDNGGNNYILTCIDVFSKMGYARPIKNKTSTSIIPAFESIFKNSGLPKKIQTDKGSEFLNKAVQQFFIKNRIRHFTTENESIKASICERWNKTLLGRLYRFFTFRKTRRNIDVLPKIVSSYNRSYHQSIKRRPIDVSVDNEEDVWQALYSSKPPNKKPSTLKPGDLVRISKAKKVFRKGYLPTWSEELFTIDRVLQTKPVTFTIKDDSKKNILGSFYEPELQKVGDKKNFEIERIIRQKKNSSGRWEVLVKWSGYLESFNSWIFKSTIQKLKR